MIAIISKRALFLIVNHKQKTGYLYINRPGEIKHWQRNKRYASIEQRMSSEEEIDKSYDHADTHYDERRYGKQIVNTHVHL